LLQKQKSQKINSKNKLKNKIMENTRKIAFEVPVAIMAAFSEMLTKKELINEIIEVTEQGAIVVEVSFERNESKTIDKLENYFNELIENMEAEEEDEEEEDDEDGDNDDDDEEDDDEEDEDDDDEEEDEDEQEESDERPISRRPNRPSQVRRK
jgi:hypothetical protein